MSDLDLVGSSQAGWRAGEALTTALFNVLKVIIKPLSMVSRVIVRKSFGERYLSPMIAIVSSALVGFVVLAEMTHFAESAMPRFYMWLTGATEFRYPLYFLRAEWWFPTGVMVAFVAAVWEHRFQVWGRYKRGEKWHSYCSGIARISGVNKVTQGLLVAIGAAVAGFAGCVWLSGLLFASLVATMVLDLAESKVFYNRVLDVLDAEIESETLGRAVKDRLKPQQANGLFVQLPSYINAGTREKIARAFGSRAQTIGSATNHGHQRANANGFVEAKVAEPAAASMGR